jgi:tetratricopeptide (TPR) repeat protein
VRSGTIFSGTVLAALLFALLPIRVVSAQSDADTRTARREFEAGRAAYEEGRFEDALVHFETAYEVTDSPEILYNIATVADRLRRDELALESYERFLEERPDTPDREHIEGRIRVLREATESSETSAAPVDTPPDAAEGETQPTETPEPPSEGGGGRLFTWIALGGAVAFGGGTAGFWLAAQNEYDSLAATCAPECSQTIVDASSGPLFQTLGNVFFGVSLAALATAVVLFFVEGGGGESEDAAVAVGVTPGGMRVWGRF